MPHNFVKGDYLLRKRETKKNIAGIRPRKPKSTQEVFRVVNTMKRDKADPDLLVTDGYYFFVISGYTADYNYELFDPLAGALLEKQHYGALRPSKAQQKWTIGIKRKHRIEDGVALERLTVDSLRPGKVLPKIELVALFPSEVLKAIWVTRDGAYTYASASALTRALTHVKWTKVNGYQVRGVIELPEFRMKAESLK